MAKDSSKLMSQFFLIGRRLREESAKKGEKNACSMLHFEVLRFIEHKGKPSMRDIATYLSVTPPSATLLIDGMVTYKTLRRIVDPKDRRTVRVALAPKGKETLARGIHDKMKKIKEMFAVLDPKEHAELIRLLEKITESK